MEDPYSVYVIGEEHLGEFLPHEAFVEESHARRKIENCEGEYEVRVVPIDS